MRSYSRSVCYFGRFSNANNAAAAAAGQQAECSRRSYSGPPARWPGPTPAPASHTSPVAMPARHSEPAAQLSASLMTPAVCRTRGSGAEWPRTDGQRRDSQRQMEGDHTMKREVAFSIVVKVTQWSKTLFQHHQKIAPLKWKLISLSELMLSLQIRKKKKVNLMEINSNFTSSDDQCCFSSFNTLIFSAYISPKVFLGIEEIAGMSLWAPVSLAAPVYHNLL